MIASHFASPVERVLAKAAILLSGPSDEAEQVGPLGAGEPFSLLDDRLGWAWGYAGAERLVGYVPSEALATP